MVLSARSCHIHSNDDVVLTSDMLLNTTYVSSGPLSLFLSNSLSCAMISLIVLLIHRFCVTIHGLFSFHSKVCIYCESARSVHHNEYRYNTHMHWHTSVGPWLCFTTFPLRHLTILPVQSCLFPFEYTSCAANPYGCNFLASLILIQTLNK